MALRDWFSQRTPLQLALERGTKPGADLAEELEKIDDYKIKSQADADAICKVLGSHVAAGAKLGGDSAFRALVGLFQ